MLEGRAAPRSAAISVKKQTPGARPGIRSLLTWKYVQVCRVTHLRRVFFAAFFVFLAAFFFFLAIATCS
jgi:hypothetical protein